MSKHVSKAFEWLVQGSGWFLLPSFPVTSNDLQGIDFSFTTWNHKVVIESLLPVGLKSLVMTSADRFIVYCKSGWWFQPLWNMLVSWDDYSQDMEKKMIQTTKQVVKTSAVWECLGPMRFTQIREIREFRCWKNFRSIGCGQAVNQPTQEIYAEDSGWQTQSNW
jgi:hypothetical protein